MKREAAFSVVILAVALGAPFAVSDFWTFVFIEILVFALYAVTFNLLLGYGGMLAFGHAVFFGIGAYCLAIMMKKIGLGALVATIISPLMAAAAGAIIGYFCVRLSGIYFGMLTFAFQMLVYTIVFKSYELTGGDDGLSGINAGGIAATPQGLYYVTLIVVAVGLWLLWRLVHSPFGLALRAQRSNDRKSLALGINVRLHKWLTLVIAAFFAGTRWRALCPCEPECISWMAQLDRERHSDCDDDSRRNASIRRADHRRGDLRVAADVAHGHH